MSLRFASIVFALAMLGVLAGAAMAWHGWTDMNHTTGTVAALADGLAHREAPGDAGPDSHLDTVYMPVYPAGLALLRRTGWPWLPVLRIGSLLSCLFLLLATGWATRRADGGPATALVAMALVACSAPVHVASLSGRADLLAAAATLAAIGAWLGRKPADGWTAAGFAALAVLTRASSITLPLAVVVRAVLERDARPAFRFALQFLIALAVLGLALVPIHGPQWVASVLHQMARAPLNTTLPVRGPLELLRYLGSFAELAVIAALGVIGLSGTRNAGVPLRASAAVSLVIALGVLSNHGSDHNHLIELIAIGSLAAAGLGERLEGDARRLFAALVLIAVVSASWREAASVRSEAANPMTRREAITSLVQAERGEVLCEDAMLSLAGGRRPVFADPASVRAVALADFPGSHDIEQDVLRQRWSLLVSEHEVEPDLGWYRDYHLGAALSRAIASRYERVGTVDGYPIWRPRARVTPRAAR